MYLIGSGHICKTAGFRPARFEHAYDNVIRKMHLADKAGDSAKVWRMRDAAMNFDKAERKYVHEPANKIIDKWNKKYTTGWDALNDLGIARDKVRQGLLDKELATTRMSRSRQFLRDNASPDIDHSKMW